MNNKQRSYEDSLNHIQRAISFLGEGGIESQAKAYLFAALSLLNNRVKKNVRKESNAYETYKQKGLQKHNEWQAFLDKIKLIPQPEANSFEE